MEAFANNSKMWKMSRCMSKLTSGSRGCPLSLRAGTLDRAKHRGSSLGNSILHYEPLVCTNQTRCKFTSSSVKRHARYSRHLFLQRKTWVPCRTSTSWYTQGHGRAGQVQHQVTTGELTGHAHTWRSESALTPAAVVDFTIGTISSLRLWIKMRWRRREFQKKELNTSK